MILITWWEREELEEHLRERPDIWVRHPKHEHVWLRRTGSDGQFTMAIATELTPRCDPSHFDASAKGLSVPDSEAYALLQRCLEGWTSFSLRMEIYRVLRQEFYLSRHTARTAAHSVVWHVVQPNGTREEREARRDVWRRYLDVRPLLDPGPMLPFGEAQ